MLVQTAKAWRQKPSALGLCTEDEDIVYMVAWERTENLMAAWDQQEAMREAKRAKNRP